MEECVRETAREKETFISRMDAAKGCKRKPCEGWKSAKKKRKKSKSVSCEKVGEKEITKV